MVRAMVMCLLAAACGDGSDVGDAGVDGAVGGDAGQSDASDVPTGGLIFELVAVPALPEVTADLLVDEVRLELRDVRAIGDSAPGDARTSIASLSLEWRPGDEPRRLAFPLAPPGIYSSLQARFGGGFDEALEIRGRVRRGGELVTFHVEHDDLAAPIVVDLGGLAVASAPRTAVVSMSLSFLGGVPWDQIELEDGELKVEADDPQMAAVVSGLQAAFSLVETR
jgi:hypothetical protein